MCIYFCYKKKYKIKKTAVRRDTSEYANTRLKFQRLKSSPLIKNKKKISKQFSLVSRRFACTELSISNFFN